MDDDSLAGRVMILGYFAINEVHMLIENSFGNPIIGPACGIRSIDGLMLLLKTLFGSPKWSTRFPPKDVEMMITAASSIPEKDLLIFPTGHECSRLEWFVCMPSSVIL
jgi:hypothetical protein